MCLGSWLNFGDLINLGSQPSDYIPNVQCAYKAMYILVYCVRTDAVCIHIHCISLVLYLPHEFHLIGFTTSCTWPICIINHKGGPCIVMTVFDFNKHTAGPEDTAFVSTANNVPSLMVSVVSEKVYVGNCMNVAMCIHVDIAM